MNDRATPPNPTAHSAEIGPEGLLKSGDSRKSPPLQGRGEEDAPSEGPNLLVAYGLIAFALLVALALAALIVLPFYKAR